MLESVACYVCGTSENKLWSTENGYTAVRCSECGLIYVNPRPALDSISQAARTGLHEGDQQLDVAGRYGGEKAIRRFRHRLHDLYGPGYLYQSGERWLDVGSGYGEFLEALRFESGSTLKLTGLEPNVSKAESARKRGLNVGFSDLSELGQRFHYVSLLNVYSHLPSPPETLAQLHELIEPGGELLLQTGNFAELEPAEIRVPLDLPDHLSFACERLVVRQLERAGFSLRKVMRYPMFGSPTGIRRLAQRLRGSPPKRQCLDLWFRARRA